MITVLSVKEMCCPVEGRAVEKALRAMEGVEDILFDYAARTVRVTHGTVAVEALVREVEKLGMTARVSEAAKSEAPAISIRVPEMDCPVEAAQIEKAFAAAGLPKATFDTERRVVRVAASFEAAKAAIESCGYRAELLREPSGRIVFKVPDMDCPVEVAEIQKALQKRGIEGAECDTEARTVTLSGDEATAKTVKEAIESCGYEAERIRTSSGRIVFKVPDMDCPVEVAEIQKALAKRGIEGAECDTESRTVTIAGDEATAKTVQEAIESCGYGAERVRKSERIVFKVPEMDCPVEVAEIQKALAKRGIEGAECNTESRTVTIAGDEATAEAVKAAIESCGYEATRVEVKRKAAAPEADPIPWGRYITALVIGLLSEAVELWSHYAAESLPVSVETASWASIVFALIAIALAGLATFRSGLTALRHGNLNMNALMSVAVVGGVLIGAWPEAAMVMTLFQISESIEQLAMNRARNSIRDLMSVAPEKAMVRQADGRYVEEAVAEVLPGAVVRVSPGDRVPLDGKILKGATSLDESMVTGEGLPAEKGENATVWAGTVNLTATIEVLVTAAATDSLTARIIDAVENAQSAKSPVQRFVDRFATIYTPLVFVVALVVAIVPPLFFGDWGGWFYKALCLLVIACPCALVISTPVTVVSGLATATRCGLLVKGGLYLEEARKLRFVGLDKTGTLTKGEPAVADVFYPDDFDHASADRMAASLAAMNKHPLSQAIVRWADKKGIEPQAVEGFSALPGSGVTGRVGSGTLWLVNERTLDQMGVLTPDVHDAFVRYAEAGMSTVALTDRFGVRAVFGLADTVKDDAAEGLRQLRAVGLTPRLLTGDTPAAAKALAKELGLEDVRAGLLPDDKLREIEAMQKEGLTAMVGDGINDAPALARSDIGIAMGVRGTDSAIEAAHVAVMDDKIGSIATLVRLSRITHAVLIENITIALGIKFLFAALALFGVASMWMAVFADVGTCLIVVANGMRMLRMKPRLDAMAKNAA